VHGPLRQQDQVLITNLLVISKCLTKEKEMIEEQGLDELFKLEQVAYNTLPVDNDNFDKGVEHRITNMMALRQTLALERIATALESLNSRDKAIKGFGDI
jgi:hypothetical protein